MAQLFHHGANNIAKASLVIAVLLGGVAFYVYTQIARSSYLTNQFVERQQPVQFSHKHHVGDDGIDCRYCHTSVETSYSAGIPPTQTCMNCHNQLWSDSPYLEPVRASFRDNKPIEWERVHDLPEFAYFNHSIHIAKVAAAQTIFPIFSVRRIFAFNEFFKLWSVDKFFDTAPIILSVLLKNSISQQCKISFTVLTGHIF